MTSLPNGWIEIVIVLLFSIVQRSESIRFDRSFSTNCKFEYYFNQKETKDQIMTKKIKSTEDETKFCWGRH